MLTEQNHLEAFQEPVSENITIPSSTQEVWNWQHKCSKSIIYGHNYLYLIIMPYLHYAGYLLHLTLSWKERIACVKLS